MKFLLLASALVLLSGCTNLTSPARMHELNSESAYWFDYDASRRGALLVRNDENSVNMKNPIRVCAEPTPDIALSLISKLEVQAKGKESVEGKGSAEFKASVVKLAERTQMVQFLREALYRLCEQSMNGNIEHKYVSDAYMKVIDTALAMAEADREQAKEAVQKEINKSNRASK